MPPASEFRNRHTVQRVRTPKEQLVPQGQADCFLCRKPLTPVMGPRGPRWQCGCNARPFVPATASADHSPTLAELQPGQRRVRLGQLVYRFLRDRGPQEMHTLVEHFNTCPSKLRSVLARLDRFGVVSFDGLRYSAKATRKEAA